jgi:hypothetical protein
MTVATNKFKILSQHAEGVKHQAVGSVGTDEQLFLVALAALRYLTENGQPRQTLHLLTAVKHPVGT